MKRGIIPLAVISAVSGCAADGSDGGILVLKNVHPATMCMTNSLDTETSISRGELDLLQPSDYLFIAQMRSRITALTGQEDQRTIIATGAKIDIAFPGNTLFSEAELADLKTAGLTHFKSLFSTAIPPGALRDGDFVLIPVALVEQIAAKAGITSTTTSPQVRIDAVATFTIEGDMSGATVTSQPFTFPVTIGNGLTINVGGGCPLAKGSTVRTGYVCNAVQDGAVDCCTVGPGKPLMCPASVSAM